MYYYRLEKNNFFCGFPKQNSAIFKNDCHLTIKIPFKGFCGVIWLQNIPRLTHYGTSRVETISSRTIY